MEHEYCVLKQLEGGVGIPRALWFGRESAYHVLVIDLLGPSLQDLFLAHNRKFSLHTVADLGDQIVSQISSGRCTCRSISLALTPRVHPLT